MKKQPSKENKKIHKKITFKKCLTVRSPKKVNPWSEEYILEEKKKIDAKIKKMQKKLPVYIGELKRISAKIQKMESRQHLKK